MAPDADKLRQRNNGSTLKDASSVSTTTANTIKTIETLKANEIAIDGVVYDISNFDHPGGETINVFGGNDASTVYRMIHPHHAGGKNKHLEKLEQVGIIKDYKCEYKFDTEFEREIKEEVFKIVKRGKEFGTTGYFVRAISYIVLFCYLHYLWVYAGQVSYTLAIVYGVSQALIGLNVQHDANHGAASRKTWINDLLGLGADFIGGSKWLWMEKHWWVRTYISFNSFSYCMILQLCL